MFSTKKTCFLIAVFSASILAYPMDLAEQERKRAIVAQNFKGLKDTTTKILCRINIVSKNSKVLQMDVKKDYDFIKLYKPEFQDKCMKQFSHIVEDLRFVNGMKMIQQLVGLAQDLQVTESRLNAFDETPLVKDYRQIEFYLRDLVEGEMRKVAFEIFDHKNFASIPAYSVGGLYDSDKANKDHLGTARSRNRVKLDQIQECLKLFVVKVLNVDLDLC